MILREMRIQECWCEKCAAGQMEQIHDLQFKDRVLITDLIGKKIVCHKCGHENVIEDFLSILPTAYLVSAQSEISKVKANTELHNWLKSEES